MSWTKTLVGAILVIAGVVWSSSASAATRLFYYREGKLARQSLMAHPSYIDILAPQSYHVDENGILTGTIDQTILDFAAKHKIKVLPLLTNGAFSPQVATTILDDPLKQDLVINQLIAEARSHHYAGWQIDFEQIEAPYRDQFSQFIAKFGQALQQNRLMASVAVVAQVSANPEDYPRDLWRRLIGLYDYAALARSVDFVSVMAYDDPESTGPVAGYPWLARVLAHALPLIPKAKLSLGLGLYYWHWNVDTGKRIGIGGYEGLARAIAKHYTTQEYSALEQAPYLRYRSQNQNYVIWFENAQSVRKKLGLVSRLGLHGFSAWALGLEVPRVYEAIRKDGE